MKISWILWWIISIGEIIVFLGLSVLLWSREIDAAGAIQTTELKLINIAVLAAAFLIPAIIQITWLIINIIYSKKQKTHSVVQNF
ncbi:MULTISPECIES: DUF3923 family protein [Staphylococcaceae]|uniref:DUF3923 family protein n=1 Tax=Staphylococcaceae TaxID=90964 RepID=UPI0009F23FCF|nr:DUF3923 family protein [Staphylococcus sp. HMSC072B07]HCW7724589.1 DUF3923 family protein [Staphylococcus aureus]